LAENRPGRVGLLAMAKTVGKVHWAQPMTNRVHHGIIIIIIIHEFHRNASLETKLQGREYHDAMHKLKSHQLLAAVTNGETYGTVKGSSGRRRIFHVSPFFNDIK